MIGANVRQHLAKLQALFALSVMVVVLSVANDTFFTGENFANVLRQISVNLCLSIGMTMIILSGGIDLSVGSVLALSAAIAATSLDSGLAIPRTDIVLQFTTWGAIVLAILVGAICGAVNGQAITRLGLPPFVATLGMLSIARGLTRLWTGGLTITNLPPEFLYFGVGRPLGLPMPVWISGSLAVAFAAVTRLTPFGRYLYAVGGNERAAALSGLNVGRIKAFAYILAGSLAGVAGVIHAARVHAAEPNAGESFELDSIAAVVIGGTSLSGGRGSIFGTVLGCLIIGVLNNGLVLLGVSSDWHLVVKGVVILAAVAVDRAVAQKVESMANPQSDKPRLFLLHTSATLVPVFEQLCKEKQLGATVFNMVDDSLIKDVIAHNRLRPQTARRVTQLVAAAEDAGADQIMVTCSSIGAAVETAATLASVPVLRVDRPMAEQAVAAGRRIGVIATLPTTLEPTADLVRRCAAAAGREIELTARLCAGAFEALMGGDPARHDELVLAALKELQLQVDVIALAQASMARVVSQIPEADRRVPILASPPIAIDHLARTFAQTKT